MLKRVLIAMPVIALLVIAFIYALSSHSLPIRPLTTEELLDIRAKYDMKTHEYIISKYPEFAMASYTVFYSVHDLFDHSSAIVPGGICRRRQNRGEGKREIQDIGQVH